MSPIFDRLAAALIDRYALDRDIGEGGMATVFLATDVRHERRVAIKVLHPAVSSDGELLVFSDNVRVGLPEALTVQLHALRPK